eukprot:1153510-Pelagomonas_calceolata.AAC.3
MMPPDVLGDAKQSMVEQGGISVPPSAHLVRIHLQGKLTTALPASSESLAAASALCVSGWGHILMMLAVASIFYQIPRIILALLFGTLLLPAKPVLWKRFNRSWYVLSWSSTPMFIVPLKHVAEGIHVCQCQQLCTNALPGVGAVLATRTQMREIPGSSVPQPSISFVEESQPQLLLSYKWTHLFHLPQPTMPALPPGYSPPGAATSTSPSCLKRLPRRMGAMCEYAGKKHNFLRKASIKSNLSFLLEKVAEKNGLYV